MSGENKVLIILGMHRSGTSLMAQWMHKCGLFLGHRLMTGNEHNAEGHYEDLDFHDFHEEIFRSYQVSYGGLKKVPLFSLNEYQSTKLKSIIDFKNSLKKQWGWKEPRTNVFLEHYEGILPNAYNLITFRSPLSVIDSLIRREKKEFGKKKKPFITRVKYGLFRSGYEKKIEEMYLEHFLDSWIQHNECLINYIEKKPKHSYRVVNYDKLLQNSAIVISWLQKAGFDLQDVPFIEVFNDKLLTKTPVKSYNLPVEKLAKAEEVYARLNEFSNDQ